MSSEVSIPGSALLATLLAAVPLGMAPGRALGQSSASPYLVPPEISPDSIDAASSPGLPATFTESPAAPPVLPLTAGCTADWQPTFGALPGTDSSLQALTVFDDGNGPALYLGGYFNVAGTAQAPYVARWSGSQWSSLGVGVSADVQAFAVLDDGSGPALYVGGNFVLAGGLTVNAVARWDGTSWSALGTGMNSIVYGLATFDDGSGPALYAAGMFTTAGGVAANRIARWDGSAWSSLGSGMDANVTDLCVYDDGGGPALYAGGIFTTAGGFAANRIAKWDGTTWSALGSGLNGSVRALVTYDDGSSLALYVGGAFSTAGGSPANRLARWDGSVWSALGTGVVGSVVALAAIDDGSGSKLYAGGELSSVDGVPASRIAVWDGSTWSALGAGILDMPSFSETVNALCGFDDGGGVAVYAAGNFPHAGGIAVRSVAKWRNSTWAPPGHAQGVSSTVEALQEFDDGGGPALFVGGWMSVEAGAIQYIAKWDGSDWSALGSGLDGGVYALEVFDDGMGAALYAGGSFTLAGGQAAQRVARWNGTGWSALGTGIPNTVSALAVHDDGGGPALHAAGNISPGSYGVFKWNGSTWSMLGTGMDGPVSTLATYDPGTGSELYAGGFFTTAGGMSVARIARWNGTSWSAVGGGVAGGQPNGPTYVRVLKVFDSGAGPRLFVGGNFTFPGNYVAAWNGSTFAPVGSGTNNRVHSLESFDPGTGTTLFAGGTFTVAGGSPASCVARLSGANWTAVGAGLTASTVVMRSVELGGCVGPSLYVGGSFALAIESGDAHLARYGCALGDGPLGCTSAFCFGDNADPSVLVPCPCDNFGTVGHGCAHSANAAGGLLETQGAASADTLVLSGSGMPASSTCIYLQGDAVGSFVFGDGVRCVDGALVRLRTKFNVGGASQLPDSLDTITLSQRGGVVPGSGATRYYQTYYRNAVVAFCPPATFNVTNGQVVVW